MCNETSVSQQELTEWIESALQIDNIKNIKIITSSKSSLGDGFLSNIDFVCISGDQNGKSVQLDVVVKNGRQIKSKRQGGAIRIAFKRELYIYHTLFPRLRQMELEKGIKDQFTAFPKLYKGLIFDDNEVLVFENLKTKGYKLNVNQPMNWHHKDLLLKQYAKYHALNFALRDQYYEEYKKLVAPMTNVMADFFKNDDCYELLLKCCEECNQIYKKHNKDEILVKVGHIGRKEIDDLIVKYELDCDPYSVIIHGDNWNNNFMFKYSDNDDDKIPEKVAILDWQISTKASPMCDLIRFFYNNTEADEYDNYENFIDIYYEYFSSYLKALGSDPYKMYPKNLAKQHWKEFAKNSYLIIPMVLKLRFADKSTMKENTEFKDFSNYSLKDQDKFEQCIIKFNEHFIKNGFI